MKTNQSREEEEFYWEQTGLMTGGCVLIQSQDELLQVIMQEEELMVQLDQFSFILVQFHLRTGVSHHQL